MSTFRFKQFEIQQDKCAMKIGTDGVLLGAWANIAQASSILDIGTGTGLLALMAAQRNPYTYIDAIEIESNAYQQACINVQLSPWAERIQVHHKAIQDFRNTIQYDIIISNPPYFQSKASTHIPDRARKLARTTSQLPFEILLKKSYDFLTQNGAFFLILPYNEGYELIKIAPTFKLFPKQIVEVSPRIGKAPNRLLIELSKKSSTLQTKKQAIRNEGKEYHDYTPWFRELHRDFLLKL